MQNKSRRHSMADLQKVLKKHSPKTPVKRMAPIRALSSPADAKRNAVTKSAGSAHQSEMMTSMLRLVAKNQKMAEFRKTHHARAAARTRRKDLAALGMDVESSKEVTKSVGETATRAVITVLTKRLSRLRTAEVVRTVPCAGAPPRNHIGQQLTPRCSLSLSLSLSSFSFSVRTDPAQQDCRKRSLATAYWGGPWRTCEEAGEVGAEESKEDADDPRGEKRGARAGGGPSGAFNEPGG